MKRFLRYSLEHERAIRLMYMDEEGMKQVSATVTALTESEVCFTTLRPKRNITLALEQLLSADYRKGDTESLK